MCRIASDEEWTVKREVKGTEMQMKILQQATLEASHNKKLREKLDEVDTDNCMYHCTVCTKVIACLVLCRAYNEHGYVHRTSCLVHSFSLIPAFCLLQPLLQHSF